MVRARPVSPRRLTALVSSLIFLDMITWLAAIPLIPVWQREIGLSDQQSGVVLGVYSLAVLLFAIPSGLVADRIGARRLTLIGAGAFVLAAPALAIADTFALLVLVRIAQGVCSAITWSAGLAWVAGAVGPAHRMRSIATINAMATVGTIGGPVLGGPVVALFGLGPTFIGLGVMVSAFVIWALFEPGGVRTHVAHEERTGPFAALGAAMQPGYMQLSFVAIGFISLMMAALQLLAPLYFDREGLSSSQIGWIFTIGSVLSVAAIITVTRLERRISLTRMVLVFTLVCGALAGSLLLPYSVPGYATVLIVLIAIGAPIFTVSYSLCAEGARLGGIGEGAAFGMLNAIWAVGAVISPVLSGVVAQGGRAGIVYLVIAVLSLAGALVMQRSRLAIASG